MPIAPSFFFMEIEKDIDTLESMLRITNIVLCYADYALSCKFYYLI